MSDSSSSDEDDMLEALKEATDTQFFNESLFKHKNDNEKKTNHEKSDLPKSLRRTSECVEEFNEFGVTQDFKNFVAKQLARSLDRYVEEINDNANDFNKSSNEKHNPNIPHGIKLMTDSKVNLIDVENNEEREEEIAKHNERRRKKLRSLDNSTRCVAKCKEVAVEPDWVLSKASTALWTDKHKGTLYKYKKTNDGVLVEINELNG